ncbi:MAG TPA: hypothetical protein VFT62_10395 [Mycobacteriales bacterium]|nr:hypothetical protein [Mycobacteriales bacterium]
MTTGRTPGMSGPRSDTDRLRRRAAFLREMAEAKALRERVAPRRSRRARANKLHRMMTYRHC